MQKMPKNHSISEFDFLTLAATPDGRICLKTKMFY